MLSGIFQNAIQWTVKGCMLLLYCRLFKDLTHHVILLLATAYVVVTYIVQQGLYFGYWCHPFQKMWKVPAKNIQCAFPSHHMVLNVTLNVTSDLMIFLIPSPLLFRSALPWNRRILLILPFSMGIFTIFAAIVCKVEALYLLSNEWWGIWCLREASMAVIVANVPYSWGLLRRWTNVGYFLLPSTDKLSSIVCTHTSQTSSKYGLLRAARSSLSFGSSRKHSVASRSTVEKGLPGELVEDSEHGGRTPSTPVQHPHTMPEPPSPSRAGPSTSANAVDKLYNLDTLGESISKEHPTAFLEARYGHSDGSRSWVPGMAEARKTYNFDDYYNQKNQIPYSDDASSAALSEELGTGQDV